MTIPATTQIYLTMVVLLCTEIPVLFFTILDFLKLDAVKAYRISYYDGVTRDYPTNAEIFHALKVSYASVLRVYCMPMLLSYCFDIGIPFVDNSDNPDAGMLIVQLFTISFVGDITLYATHRLFHHPYLYKKYHIKHHRDYTYTFAAVHHFFDDFESAALAFGGILPAMIMHVHLYTYLAWLFIVQISAIIGHSGYRIPGMRDDFPIFNPRYHDGHHKYVRANYGAIYTWTDKLFGTLRI